jgi:O-antigen ligase
MNTATNQQPVQNSENTISSAVKVYTVALFAYAIAGNFSISLSQIALGTALISALYMYKKDLLRIEKLPIFEPYMFFVFAGILSIFQADEKIKAIVDLKEFLVILVFYVAYHAPIKTETKRQILITMVITASITAILSLVDVALGKLIQNRAKGFFSTSITFGECQAMLAVLTATLILGGQYSKKVMAGLTICFLLTTSAMLATMSRGAWLGFAAGIFILTIKFPRKMFPTIIVCTLLSIPVINQVPSFKNRIESFNISKNLSALQNQIDGRFESPALQSNFGRLAIWTNGFKITSKNSVFGTGLDNVKNNYYKVATDKEKQLDYLIFGHQHNSFMQMLAMTGQIGLIAFFSFIIAMLGLFIKIFKNSNPVDKKLSAGALAIFSCFIATGLTEHSFGDEEVAMLAFFLSGLLISLNKQKTNE